MASCDTVVIIMTVKTQTSLFTPSVGLDNDSKFNKKCFNTKNLQIYMSENQVLTNVSLILKSSNSIFNRFVIQTNIKPDESNMIHRLHLFYCSLIREKSFESSCNDDNSVNQIHLFLRQDFITLCCTLLRHSWNQYFSLQCNA